MTKLPTADTNFKQNQAMLARFAANVYASMGSTQGLIYFPTPTVDLVTLVGAINDYTTALGNARKGYGSKADTQIKDNAKALLKQYLSINALYVTNAAQQYSGAGTSGVANTQTVSLMRQIITISGYKLSMIPSPVANTTGIPVPIVKKAISKMAGTAYFLLRQYTPTKRGVKTWMIRIRKVQVPALPWRTVTITSSNKMTITDLTSGINEYQIAGAGGTDTKNFSNNPLNWTPVAQIVIT